MSSFRDPRPGGPESSENAENTPVCGDGHPSMLSRGGAPVRVWGEGVNDIIQYKST